MSNLIYKIYAYSKKKSWIVADIKVDKEEAIECARNLNGKDFYKYMVVEHDHVNDSDFPVDIGELYQECTVTYVDDLKTDIEVIASEFKVSDRQLEKSIERE